MAMKQRRVGVLVAVASSCGALALSQPPLSGHVVAPGNATDDNRDELAIERLEFMNEGHERDADRMLQFAEKEDNLASVESKEADMKRWDSKAIFKATVLDAANSKRSKTRLVDQASDAKKLAEVAAIEYKDVRALQQESLQMRSRAEKAEHEAVKDLANEKKDSATLMAAVPREGSTVKQQQRQSNVAASGSPGQDLRVTQKAELEQKKPESTVQPLTPAISGAVSVKPAGKRAESQTLSGQASADVAEKNAEQLWAVSEEERWRAHEEMAHAKKQRDDGQVIKLAASIEAAGQKSRAQKEGRVLREAMLRASASEEAARDADAKHLEISATVAEGDATELMKDALRTQADSTKFHREAVDIMHNASVAASLQAAESKNSSTSGVSCGGHRALTCGECPQGNGEEWCNDECHWVSGFCIAIRAGQNSSVVAAVGAHDSRASLLEGDAEQVMAVAKIEDQEAKEEKQEASIQIDDGKAIKAAVQIGLSAKQAGARSGQAKMALRRQVALDNADRNTDANQLGAVAELEQQDAMMLEKESSQLRADATKFHLEAVGLLNSKAETAAKNCQWVSGVCVAFDASKPKLAFVQFLGPLQPFEA